MPHQRQTLGSLAEEIVAGRLRAGGARIVERNARTRYGEIDLIVAEGPVLAFVEVKALRSSTTAGPERPALSVGRAKQRRLRRLAAGWLAEHPGAGGYSALRFDVVGVRLDGERIAAYEHIRDAF